ncbi:MAG: DUF6491 family protein [Bdellovibrionota bacterium]
MRHIALFALALLVSTSAFAAGTCFYGRTVNSFQVTGRDTMKVRDGGRLYQVRMNFCPSLRWADRIAFDSFSSWVCRGDKVLILDMRGRVQDRCWIDEITRTR